MAHSRCGAARSRPLRHRARSCCARGDRRWPRAWRTVRTHRRHRTVLARLRKAALACMSRRFAHACRRTAVVHAPHKMPAMPTRRLWRRASQRPLPARAATRRARRAPRPRLALASRRAGSRCRPRAAARHLRFRLERTARRDSQARASIEGVSRTEKTGGKVSVPGRCRMRATIAQALRPTPSLTRRRPAPTLARTLVLACAIQYCARS